MNEKDMRNRTVRGLFWKLSENIGTQLINFTIQIILARILMPEDYGLIAMTIVFVSIANVFVQTGFGSALVQKKEIGDLECSSVFFASITVAFVLYIILFICAPYIADFYSQPALTVILRVQSLSLLFGGLSSVHNSILVRDLQFRKNMQKSLLAIILQGITGILLAFLGFGVWALIIATLVYYLVSTIVLWHIVTWRPRKLFSFAVLKILFAFSSKILLNALINSLFQNIMALIIGKKFNAETLGYYNRGFQISALIMVNTDGAINSVLFPVLSKYQEDTARLKDILRRSLRTSCFISFPLVIGLIAVANPLVEVLLTEKWLPCVPFIWITAIVTLFWPFSVKCQAFNAIGKSAVTLKLNVAGQIMTAVSIILMLPFGVYALVLSQLFSVAIMFVVIIFVTKKILQYSIREQIGDFLPSFILAAVMGLITASLELTGLQAAILLPLEIIVGILVYIGGAYLFKFEAFQYILTVFKDQLHNR